MMTRIEKKKTNQNDMNEEQRKEMQMKIAEAKSTITSLLTALEGDVGLKISSIGLVERQSSSPTKVSNLIVSIDITFSA